MHFCGNSEAFGDGSAVYKLPTNRPTWYLAGSLMPRLNDHDFRMAIKEALARWSAVCDVVAVETMDASEATEIITVANLGGPSGVLADQQLPQGGARQQLRMRVDSSEKWVLDDGPNPQGIDLVRVLCHEFGHFLGLQHLPVGPPPDLMEPSYRTDLNKPQQAEAKLVASMYGPPKPINNPLPPIPNKTVIEISGNVTGIVIPGYRVSKL